MGASSSLPGGVVKSANAGSASSIGVDAGAGLGAVR